MAAARCSSVRPPVRTRLQVTATFTGRPREGGRGRGGGRGGGQKSSSGGDRGGSGANYGGRGGGGRGWGAEQRNADLGAWRPQAEREICAFVNGGGHWQQAEKLFQAILQAAKQEGVVGGWVDNADKAIMYPNKIAYNAVLRAYEVDGQWERAEKLFGLMQTHGLQPNAITYNTLISTYEKAGHLQKAEAARLQLQQLEQASPFE
jgi:pentatricopeptide repeat protein